MAQINYIKSDVRTDATTAVEVRDRGIWFVEPGVWVVSQTGYGVHQDGINTVFNNNGNVYSWHNFAVKFDGQLSILENNPGGIISGKGGISIAPGNIVANSGHIVARSSAEAAIKVGKGDQTTLIVNTGEITGDTAILSRAGTNEINNSGNIAGAVWLFGGSDAVYNSGSITGTVKLKGGADLFDGTGGNGVTVDGGRGRDTLIGGDGDDYLIGGRGRDELVGGGGNDVLVGGLGKDILEGSDGADTFIFVGSGKNDADTIRDFTVGEDVIRLDNAHFRKLGPDGALTADAFHIGRKAADADDRVIYDDETGYLKYDANGASAGGVKLIAKLAKGLDLSHDDFAII